MGKKLRILSYNIHKGFSSTNLSFVMKGIKDSIRAVRADIVFLQEVLGHHEVHGRKLENWPTTSQFEYLADNIWPHFAYGKNAVYNEGHHGNAILSRYPISSWENIDVSVNRLERRGLLHAAIQVPDMPMPLHAICLHLGLFEGDREKQIDRLCGRIQSHVPPEAPLVVAGDFNDWKFNADGSLSSKLALVDAYEVIHGEHARTFPSWFPVLRLDRIYVRGFMVRGARCYSDKPWNALSDHIAVFAEISKSPSNLRGNLKR